MIKIIEVSEKNNGIIPMSKMKPMQVGIIVDDPYNENYVMRTQNKDKFEVMNLSKPIIDGCWDNDGCSIKVRLLGPGESIVVKLSND